VILGGDSVRLFHVVKNLGHYVDGRLSWRKQVSFVDYFPFLTGAEFSRLELAFNA
jgi:hypothetical protein